ncbi:hypothetical protein GJ496_006694 [Pomphorhynchus laevis]|nr:hypothetical protein GJ496_006694 [Pomphorhynchus laevis]
MVTTRTHHYQSFGALADNLDIHKNGECPTTIKMTKSGISVTTSTSEVGKRNKFNYLQNSTEHTNPLENFLTSFRNDSLSYSCANNDGISSNVTEKMGNTSTIITDSDNVAFIANGLVQDKANYKDSSDEDIFTDESIQCQDIHSTTDLSANKEQNINDFIKLVFKCVQYRKQRKQLLMLLIRHDRSRAEKWLEKRNKRKTGRRVNN